MEPSKTHGATLPQQGFTRPVEGCPSGPRPEDLLRGGHEGANPHVGTRTANDAVDRATADAPKTPEVTANLRACTRFHILECFYAESKKYKKNGSPDDLTPSDLTSILSRELGEQLKDLSSSEEGRLLKEVVYPFLTKAMGFYKKCHNNKTWFRDKHRVYLNKLFIDDIPADFKRVAADFSKSSEMFSTSEPLKRVAAEIASSSEVSCPSPDLERVAADLEKSSEVYSTAILPESTLPCVTQSAATLMDSTGMSSLKSPKSTNDSSISYKQDLKIRKRIMESLQGQPRAKVIKAFASTITSDDGSEITAKASKDLEKVIKHCLKTPKEPSVVLKKVSTVPKPYTPEEALKFIIDRKLSAKTYKILRKDLISRGYPAYPPYHEVINARKALYPEGSSNLSSLLDEDVNPFNVDHCNLVLENENDLYEP